MGAAAVDWANFLETWVKFSDNLTRVKVGYEKTTGLYFMSGHFAWQGGLEDTNRGN